MVAQTRQNTLVKLVANFAGRCREATLEGRRYLVAPATIMVETVMNGSQGALWYPAAEIAKNAGAWNGIPLTLWHPFDPITNAPLSATDRGVAERQGIGLVRGDRIENGKRRVEVWADVEKVKNLDARYGTHLLANLRAGRPIELSTGLFTENEPKTGNCPSSGKRYAAIARNYRPDHLAILPDQVGACSVADGCGVHNRLTANGGPGSGPHPGGGSSQPIQVSERGVKVSKANRSKLNITDVAAKLEEKGHQLLGGAGHDLKTETTYYHVKHADGTVHKMSAQDTLKLASNQSTDPQCPT